MQIFRSGRYVLKQASMLPITHAHITQIDQRQFAMKHQFQWKSSGYPCINKWQDSLAYFANARINGVVCVNPNGIPANTPIMEYTGELVSIENTEEDVYGTSYTSLFGYKYSMTAKRVGNLSRFLPSLPEAETLKKEYTLDSTHKDKVATANCILKTNLFGSVLVYTLREVQYGEILGFCYGDDFWHYRRIDSKGKDRLLLFEQYTGRVIDAKRTNLPILASYKQLYTTAKSINSHNFEVLPYKEKIAVDETMLLLGYIDINWVQKAALSETGIYVVAPVSNAVSYIPSAVVSQYLRMYFSAEEFSDGVYDDITNSSNNKLRSA